MPVYVRAQQVNRVFRTQFTDSCYDSNAFWARHLEALVVDYAGFEIDTPMRSGRLRRVDDPGGPER